MGRQFFIWVALVAFLPTSFIQAKEKTIFEQWDESEIEIENVVHFINQDTCYLNEERFAGCVLALSSMADASDENIPQALYSKSFATSHPEIVEKILAEYSPFAVVQVRKGENKASRYQGFLQDSKNRNEFMDDLGRLYKAKVFINFSRLLNIFSNQIPDSKKKFFYGNAINVFLRVSEDAHAEIYPKSISEGLMTNRSFGGIGAEIKAEDSVLKVAGLMEDSPAQIAGLQVGDIFMAINNRSVAGLKIEEIVSLLRGEINTEVLVTVKRDNREITVKITRAKVTQKNVSSKLVNDMGSVFGFVRMNQFNEDSCIDVFNAIGDLRLKSERKMAGLILDLRGNPGGIIGEGSCLGHIFVGDDKTITELKTFSGAKGSFEDKKILEKKPSSTVKYLMTIPLVILVDGGSASASELSAGALQDYKRAWLIGERTFGKGTAQAMIPSKYIGVRQYDLPDDFSIKLTTSRFYLPSGTSNQIIGLTPEFVVPFKPDATEEERFVEREGDMFSNALKPVTDSRPNLRPEETATIQKCADAKRAEKIYEGLVATKTRGDYQLLKAQEILSCSISLK